MPLYSGVEVREGLRRVGSANYPVVCDDTLVYFAVYSAQTNAIWWPRASEAAIPHLVLWQQPS